GALPYPSGITCVLMLALLASSLLAAAPDARAQADQPRPPSEAGAQSAAELPAVTVTARKREESAQDVPISATVINGKTAATAASAADENAGLARSTPNLSFADSGGQFGNLFIIRGVGS